MIVEYIFLVDALPDCFFGSFCLGLLCFRQEVKELDRSSAFIGSLSGSSVCMHIGRYEFLIAICLSFRMLLPRKEMNLKTTF